MSKRADFVMMLLAYLAAFSLGLNTDYSTFAILFIIGTFFALTYIIIPPDEKK